MTEDFLKDVMKSSRRDGYLKARYEWHHKMINMMKWAHNQAELHEDNIEVYLAYQKCFDKLDEVLDEDYRIKGDQIKSKYRFLEGDKYDF